MKVCIHRGSHEIGGSCVEIAAAGKRIVIDLGMPLDKDVHEAGLLPAVDGLLERDEELLGVLVSHPHQDHWGLVPQIRRDLPVYIGKAAHRILREAAFFGTGDFDPFVKGYLEDRKMLEIGPFRITPFLNDHSAFDAYSLLVEADGKRLFYTGDYRAHGRKKALFERLLRTPPTDIDVLLTEGTTVSSDGVHRNVGLTEQQLEDRLTGLFETEKKAVLVAMSAQNIDRLVSVYRACLRAKRSLVVDLYSATVAQATEHESIPKPGFPSYNVWVPQSQRVKVKNSREFHRVKSIRSVRIYPDRQFAAVASNAVFLFRGSMAGEFEKTGILQGASLVWSLWDGYLASHQGKAIRSLVEQHDMTLSHIHSSGHAGVNDIRRLVRALQPKRVVPMHTFGASQFAGLLQGIGNVELQDDGTWWNV